MSYTNQTPNYGLPQYVADDKPTYLGDFNKAMLDIDTNMKSIDTKATSAVATADNASANATEALSTAQTAQTTASSANTKAENAQTTASNAQTTASNAQSTASTALSNSETANSTANSAKQTAETANSTASSANTKAENAQTIANQALSKTNIVFNTVLETDQNIVNIPNLDFANNIGYKIYINGTGEITNGSQGELMTICAQVPGATKLINRMMGMQIVPTNENVMKIQNDNFQQRFSFK